MQWCQASRLTSTALGVRVLSSPRARLASFCSMVFVGSRCALAAVMRCRREVLKPTGEILILTAARARPDRLKCQEEAPFPVPSASKAVHRYNSLSIVSDVMIVLYHGRGKYDIFTREVWRKMYRLEVSLDSVKGDRLTWYYAFEDVFFGRNPIHRFT